MHELVVSGQISVAVGVGVGVLVLCMRKCPTVHVLPDSVVLKPLNAASLLWSDVTCSVCAPLISPHLLVACFSRVLPSHPLEMCVVCNLHVSVCEVQLKQTSRRASQY